MKGMTKESRAEGLGVALAREPGAVLLVDAIVPMVLAELVRRGGAGGIFNLGKYERLDDQIVCGNEQKQMKFRSRR
jgi:hypothetical protein